MEFAIYTRTKNGAPLQRLRQSQKLLWFCIHASDLPWA
jgi:hypothetical protein